ncbi:MAG: SMI1/KNR4 family protein [Planctomycetaceae bacterium]
MSTFDMTTISQLCEEILQQHAGLGRNLETLLLPGASSDDVSSISSDLGLIIPNSVIELYCWRNGTQEGTATFSEMAFFPIWFMMSLDESKCTYQRLADYVGDIWNPSCFPIFASGSGDYIGVCCEQNSTSEGRMECYRHATGINVEYRSLESMLETILDAFRGKLFFMGDDGRFRVKRAEYRLVAHRLNPGLERWVPRE